MKRLLFLMILINGGAEGYPLQHRGAVGRQRDQHQKYTVRHDFKKSIPFFRACTAECGVSSLETLESTTLGSPTLGSLGLKSPSELAPREEASFKGDPFKVEPHALESQGTLESTTPRASGTQERESNTLSSKESPLYIFISFSLHKVTLKELMQGNHLLVLRGLKKDYRGRGSWRETVQALSDLGPIKNIIIDPTLFKTFNIKRVPTFVKNGGKVSGNITPQKALEILS